MHLMSTDVWGCKFVSHATRNVSHGVEYTVLYLVAPASTQKSAVLREQWVDTYKSWLTTTITVVLLLI